MGRIVNLDGTLVAPEQAVVSVFDRGFLYGDSVYEVVRTYRGVLFELPAHLDRLAESARRIALELPWPVPRLAAESKRTVNASGNPESYLRIVVTRGEGELGLDPALARGGRVVLIAQPLTTPPPEAYRSGVTLALVGAEATGRHLREAIDPAAKTGNHLNAVLAMKAARERGAYEALLVDAQGRVTEASSANVFAVRRGELATPPLGAGILEGVTRRVVLALAQQIGIPAAEAELWPDDLCRADEVFITSTTRELVPVTHLARGEKDTVTIGSGRPGPVTLRLLEAFRARAIAEVAAARTLGA
ncbi:MAG TPA: aminotransferase class IV [Myxococcales bacterium]